MCLEVRQRKRLQVREEVVPHVVFDIARSADEDAALQEEKQSADDADCEEQRGIHRQLPSRDAPVQIVDRIAEDQRRSERDGARADHTDEAEEKRTAVAEHVSEKTPKGGHDLSITSTIAALLSLPYTARK